MEKLIVVLSSCGRKFSFIVQSRRVQLTNPVFFKIQIPLISKMKK